MVIWEWSRRESNPPARVSILRPGTNRYPMLSPLMGLLCSGGFAAAVRQFYLLMQEPWQKHYFCELPAEAGEYKTSIYLAVNHTNVWSSIPVVVNCKELFCLCSHSCYVVRKLLSKTIIRFQSRHIISADFTKHAELPPAAKVCFPVPVPKIRRVLISCCRVCAHAGEQNYHGA